jgi:hypothetical protein
MIKNNAQAGLRSIKEDIRSIVLLLIICCLAYWPITFHILSLKNDALNYFLPVRFQISEAIYNHQLPFWSPYFNLGYPLHGDMQSGVWNPIVQFLSLFGPYTLYKLQLETVFYIFLSGTGMYFLLRQAGTSLYAAIFASAAYMLCGFNSDCCQYLNWISSAAYLPYVVLFFYRMLQNRNITASLLTGFFLYLMFVSAYPAHFIVTLYVLLSIFVYHLMLQTRRKEKPLLRLLSDHFTRMYPAILCFLILSAPAILSYIQFLPLSQRGNGASFQDAMSNPLHPLLLFGYLIPLPVYSAPFAGITDGLERNSYIGIITFIFALTSFFIKTKNPRIKFCRMAVIIFAIMSLGEFGGLRPLTYYILPLMNTFRHPAGLKLFTTFFSCILASWSFQRFITGKLTAKTIKIAGLVCVSILILFLIFSLPVLPAIIQKISAVSTVISGKNNLTIAPSLKNFLAGFSFRETILTDTALQLVFLSVFFFLIIRKGDYKTIVWLNILNCTLHICLFTPYTVVKKDTTAAIQHILDENIVRGYPLPDLHSSPAENSAGAMSRFDEIGCLNLYNKKIGRVDYRISPSNLLSQNDFWFDTAIRDIVMTYPILYRPDSVITSKALFLKYAAPGRKLAIIADSLISASINAEKRSIQDKIAITRFAPDRFIFTSHTASPSFYILLQNDYPLWKLKIDGTSKEIIPSNLSFIGFRVPEGDHTIELHYSSRPLIISWILSMLLTLILLGILVVQYLRGFSVTSSDTFYHTHY